jgi:hypothetical protein
LRVVERILKENANVPQGPLQLLLRHSGVSGFTDKLVDDVLNDWSVGY